MMMGYALVMFSVLMVILLILISPYIAAGEMVKDEKHLAAVEKVGSDFIPLVVESFRVWTPFALMTLRTIVDHTTPCSGVPPRLARKNLLEQLSVALWMNNAKMILRY